ncbi:DNA-directed RNA polymerase subunit delta [Peribacillus frigoritolerans]|uniref:DNA-directed RNA polymerase subunit delta n=1 Tax=Peribacillus frigoritolerans TaxID=450367 RepID=UPI00105A4752|nr:DNA-directed RNA polymerase subunit delta [Peribacillus frigoritolerans]TDL79082.1 DNA-directed RNA polymerase subunit delta [Peribacillus frigoritolerans]
MSISQYSKDQLKELSMVEVAYDLMTDKKQPYLFKDLVKEISQIIGLTQSQVEDKISQFYTDLNIDGRYICVGENTWGLRSWYPYEQIEEEVVPVAKPKKKKAKKAVVEELELEDFDEVDEEELEYDDIEEYEDDTDDDLDDDDDDLDDDAEEIDEVIEEEDFVLEEEELDEDLDEDLEEDEEEDL